MYYNTTILLPPRSSDSSAPTCGTSSTARCGRARAPAHAPSHAPSHALLLEIFQSHTGTSQSHTGILESNMIIPPQVRRQLATRLFVAKNAFCRTLLEINALCYELRTGDNTRLLSPLGNNAGHVTLPPPTLPPPTHAPPSTLPPPSPPCVVGGGRGHAPPAHRRAFPSAPCRSHLAVY